MKIFRKTLTYNELDFYRTHIQIICVLVKIELTIKEITVLAAFMALKGDIKEDLFGSTGRSIVRQRCEVSLQGLSNYLNTLKDKNVIIQENNVLKINKVFILDVDSCEYSLKLLKNTEHG
jgi:hypothetical protein